MPGWVRYKTEPRQVGETPTTLDIEDNTTLMAESEEELKSLLMRVREESERACLKLNTEKLASSPITSWQIEKERQK